MHSFLIALVYLGMIFAPCAIAQWGDVLTLPGFHIFLGRSRRSSDPYLAVLRAVGPTDIVGLMGEAFSAPAALPPFGTSTASLAAALEAVSKRDAFAVGAARVAARLAQMVEARQRELAAFAENFAEETVAAAPVAAHNNNQAYDGAIFAAAPLQTPAGAPIERPHAQCEPAIAARLPDLPPPPPLQMPLQETAPDVHDTESISIAA